MPPTPSHLFPVPSSSTWKRGGVWMCKLGMISQERLRCRLSYYWVLIGSIIYAASIGTTMDNRFMHCDHTVHFNADLSFWLDTLAQCSGHPDTKACSLTPSHYTVHFNVDLSLWLDSPMFWTPWHQNMSTYSQPCFSISTWTRGGIWMCKLGMISQERLKMEVKLLLSAERKYNICCFDWHNNG